MNREIFIETKNVLAFRKAMTALTDMETGYPGLGLVWGRAGRGKTEAAKEYAVRTGAVYLRTMEGWTQRAMLAELCRKLAGAESHTTDGCRRIARDALETWRRPILVDEADRLRVDRRVNLLDSLRDIHEMTQAPIIFIGEDSIYSRVQSRERIRSRVAQRVGFEPITPADIVTFGMRACKGVKKIEPEAAQSLHIRSKGDFRPVMIDLTDLERICRVSGKSTITADMVDTLPDRRGEAPKLD